MRACVRARAVVWCHEQRPAVYKVIRYISAYPFISACFGGDFSSPEEDSFFCRVKIERENKRMVLFKDS